MRAVICLALVGSILGACSALNKWVGLPDDNPIEEIAEQQLKNQIGLDIDFTPDSPELK